jgi:hypothetical protein
MEINTKLELLLQQFDSRMNYLFKKHPDDFESIDGIKYEIYDVKHMSNCF